MAGSWSLLRRGLLLRSHIGRETGERPVCPQVFPRFSQSLASGSGPGFSFSYHFDRNNHLTPTSCTNGAGNFCYDGAGNLHYDGLGGGWGYDAEGRVFAYSSISTSASYTSDGLGQRVQRIVNGTTYDYVFDNQGHENTKATGGFAASAWSELYLGGMHVSTYANGSTYFSHSDHLGSERTETDPTGNTNGSYQTNLPFGEWTGGGFESEKGFTGDLFDNADGYVSHTPFRQYTQAQGRWMTPDPAGLAAVNPMNPQTWNRYAYVGNNPVSFRDPSGLVSIPNVGNYMGGGGGDFNCQQDGVDQSCATVSSVLAGGAAAQCPNNACSGFTDGGKFVQFYAFAGGTSGYFSPSDVAQGVWEWNGQLLTAAGWKQLTQPYSDKMQTMLAGILGVDPSKLTPLGLQGGNADFSISEQTGNTFITDDSTCASGSVGIRCADDNLHFTQLYGDDGQPSGYSVHMDSADPYSGLWGAIVHLGVDVIGGNVIFLGVPH